MNNRRHDHNLAAAMTIVIVILAASRRSLPGLQDIAAVLPSLIELLGALRR